MPPQSTRGILQYAFRPGPWQRLASVATPNPEPSQTAVPSGVHYQCQRCTNCCRWPGFVRVDAADIARLAAHLSIPEHHFIQRFTRLRPQRDGLALTDKLNGECVFLSGRDCAVQDAKPRQCRGFPNTWNFPGWQDVCEAIPLPAGNTPVC